MLTNQIDRARLQAGQAKVKNLNRGLQKTEMAPEEITRAAEEFEAVFLSQMLTHMFDGVDIDPLNDSPGEDIYQTMMVDEYGKLLARTGGIGVADHVKREMLAIQEAKHGAQD
jgi:peptidoglycan hydrolase FlgJ